MRTQNGKTQSGPVESGDWPTKLRAYVLSPETPRRIHGFSLLDDLAENYDFAEVVFTTLTGRPPDDDWGKAIGLAFIALAGTTIADAPIHAATLSRRCTAPPRAALSIGMLGLAEQADHLVDAPRTQSPPDRDAQTMWRQLPAPVRVVLEVPSSTAEELAVAVLRAAGLRTKTQLIAAISMARLPALAAEVDAVEPGDVRSYPMRLPDFGYQSE